MNRVITALILPCMLIGATLFAREPVPELLKRADDARGGECAKICIEAANALVERSHSFFKQGDEVPAQADMRNAMEYARRGTQESISSKKRRKETEIALRKLEKRVNDLARSVEVEQRAPLLGDIDTLEHLRAILLSSLFDLKVQSE